MTRVQRRLRSMVLATIVAVATEAFAGPLETGVELFEAGDYAGTISRLEQALAKNPGDVDALFLSGLSHQKLGDHARAVDAFGRALAIAPDRTDILLPVGISHYELGSYTEAASVLERAVDADPADASAWLFLGLNQQALNRHADSIASLRRAADLDPELRQVALLNIGLAERQLGNARSSQQSLRDAVRTDPGTDIAAIARDLSMEPPATAPSFKPWQLSVRAGVEYDDNVTTSETDVTSGEDDVAAVLEISAAYLPYKTGVAEIELGYDFYRSLYSDLSDFDLQLNTLYALGSYEIAGVDAGAAYRFTDAGLGGDDFFIIHGVQPSAGFSTRANLFHVLSYSYQDKDFEEDDDRDADQHGLNFDTYYLFPDGRSFAYCGVRVEEEDTTGPEFEYLGYYANLGLTGYVDAVPALPAKVGVRYRYYLRDFDHETPGIGDEREDQRHSIALDIRQPISRHFSAILRYEYLSADSNLPTSDFTENIVSLSVEASL